MVRIGGEGGDGYALRGLRGLRGSGGARRSGSQPENVVNIFLLLRASGVFGNRHLHQTDRHKWRVPSLKCCCEAQ